MRICVCVVYTYTSTIFHLLYFYFFFSFGASLYFSNGFSSPSNQLDSSHSCSAMYSAPCFPFNVEGSIHCVEDYIFKIILLILFVWFFRKHIWNACLLWRRLLRPILKTQYAYCMYVPHVKRELLHSFSLLQLLFLLLSKSLSLSSITSRVMVSGEKLRRRVSPVSK